MVKAIAVRELLSYSILAVPLSFAGVALYIHAPDFYATEYGVSLTSLGFILLGLRFIDAVQDPLIGYLSDRYTKIRPNIIILSLILLAISFVFLFKPLSESYLLWFAIFVLIATTSFSILAINLNTLGGLWSRDKNQKTIIAGCRETFGLIGLIAAVTLPAVLQNKMPKETAFQIVSLCLVVTIIICGYIFGKWQKQHLIVNNRKYSNNFCFSQIKNQIKNISKQTKMFFAVYGISMLASTIPAVLVLFFIRELLKLESYTGLFLLTYFLSAVIGIAIWNYVSQKIGKYKSWAVAMILAIISFFWTYFLGDGDFWPYLVICFVSGIAFGAELVLPASILADNIHDSEQEETAAMYFGILAFLAKFALAVTAATTFSYLESRGFVVGKSNSENALSALSLSYAAIPCLLKITAIYLLWRIINEKNSNFNRISNYA